MVEAITGATLNGAPITLATGLTLPDGAVLTLLSGATTICIVPSSPMREAGTDRQTWYLADIATAEEIAEKQAEAARNANQAAKHSAESARSSALRSRLCPELRAICSELDADLAEENKRIDPYDTWANARRKSATALVAALESGEPLVFSGPITKNILLFGVASLPIEKLRKFCAEFAKGKSHSARALYGLAGVNAEIRENAAKTAWIIDLSSRRGEALTVIEGERWNSIPCANTTNGTGHWVALCTPSLARARLAAGTIHAGKQQLLVDIISK